MIVRCIQAIETHLGPANSLSGKAELRALASSSLHERQGLKLCAPKSVHLRDATRRCLTS